MIERRNPLFADVQSRGTHRVVLEPTELYLIGCVTESIWTPKIQIKYIDTKNQLAHMLTKGNFTRDEWNHLLCLFNISHFSSTDCSEVMSKRTQEESGEERVAAKSRLMMSLIARAPSTLSSSALESPRKTRHESQNPLSPQAAGEMLFVRAAELHLHLGAFQEALIVVKTAPQKTRFRSANLYKEFACRSKLSEWLQRQQLN